MMLLMRYTAPAFLVPFAFVLTENGQGLLLQGGLETILIAVSVSASPCCGLGVALGGWLRGPVRLPLRLLAGAGSVVLLYLEPLWIGDRPRRARRGARCCSWSLPGAPSPHFLGLRPSRCRLPRAARLGRCLGHRSPDLGPRRLDSALIALTAAGATRRGWTPSCCSPTRWASTAR